MYDSVMTGNRKKRKLKSRSHGVAAESLTRARRFMLLDRAPPPAKKRGKGGATSLGELLIPGLREKKRPGTLIWCPAAEKPFYFSCAIFVISSADSTRL